MKTIKYLSIIAFLTIVVSFFACQDDVVTLESVRDKISSSWSADEYSATYKNQTYDVIIEKNVADSTKIDIYNFSFCGATNFVSAIVSGKNITLIEKTISEKTYKGTGLIANDYKTITWTFQVNEGNGWEDYTATYSVPKVVTKKMRNL